MFDPPPGFEDLLSDAEDCPITGEIHEIYIPRVGEVHARKPMPRAAAMLAKSVRPKSAPGEQLSGFTKFLIDHLAPREYERLLEEMLIDEDLPEDTMQRVARAVATWGTARPYTAVTTLSLYTGHNWRTVRHKLVTSGIENPMRLPSLHALLDITESIVVEALARSGEERDGPPSKGELKVRDFYNRIYRPDPVDVDDDDEKLEETPYVPPGFDDPDEIEASFDAFLMGGR